MIPAYIARHRANAARLDAENLAALAAEARRWDTDATREKTSALISAGNFEMLFRWVFRLQLGIAA